MYLVTLPPAAASDPRVFAERAREAGAAMLEIRGDLSPGLAPFESPLPLVLAPRGGDLGALARSSALRIAQLDLEDGEAAPFPRPRGCGLIASFHDHERMPSPQELRRRARRLRATGADVVKLAVTPSEPAQLLDLEGLRHELGVEGPIVITAMGPLARFDRLLGVGLNAWTYACLDEAGASAPGQLTLAEHRRLAGATPPRLFGILGGPGMRTLSPAIHRGLLQDHGLRADYAAFPTSDPISSFRDLAALGVEGFSITSPWKRKAVELMDELDPLAARLGSVNTAVLRKRRWCGFQTDVVGIVDGYPEFRGRDRVAVVGSGGVLPALLEALARLGAGRTRVHARDRAARERLARDFGVAQAGLEELATSEVDLLIWALPTDRPDVALPRARPGGLALDLRYGRCTDFMNRAPALGYAVSDGSRMLVAQALAQFELFSGETTGERDLARVLERLQSAST